MKIVAVALCGLAALVGAAVLAASGGATDRGRTGSPGTLFQAMLATMRFTSVDAAVAAGYVPNSPCISSAEGGMGIHYENFALMADPAIDPNKPEVLVYHPTNHGLRLGALEYWQVDADGRLDTDGDRPSVFGHPFDGPMPGHSPVMPVHYDLHVWVWFPNTNGLFYPWNPLVSC